MEHIDYVLNLMRFAFRANRLLYLSIAVSIFSVAIELLALSSLLPLLEFAAGKSPSADGIIMRALTLWKGAVSEEALLWLFMMLLTVRISTQIIGQALAMFLGRRVLAQLCSKAFEQVLDRLNIRELNEKSIGFYISLAGDESYRASNLVMSITQFASTAVLAVLYFFAIARFSPLTAVLILAFSLFTIIALYKVAKVSQRWGNQITELSRKANSIFLDSMNNIKAVRAFSAEKYVKNIQRKLIFGYAKTQFLIELVALLSKMLPILLLLLISGIWFASSSHAVGGSNVAFIVTLIVYLMRFFPTVGQGVTLLIKIVADAKSGRDVTEFLGSQHVDQSASAHPLGEVRQIDLLELGFSYGQGGKKKILKGVNLKFEQGKSYALVGKSGVGKSTLVDLMLKFYLPSAGEVYLNNEPVTDIADFEIRKRIILVSQEAAIFDDTVINNVRLGMEASLDEVHAACKGADIHDVIESMAEGYNTRLQYQGKNLSGGQRQRIAIARALLRNPDVLIFDESTSALDKATQEKVVENILRGGVNKIVIFVTHDPYIMQRVDQVIDMGKVNAAHRTQLPHPH